ncbi:hypothetical protein KR032_006372, partial [Drosophila birchii]
MIPNYVFTKSDNKFEYNVVKRNYRVQDAIPSRSSCRSQNTGRNKLKVKSVDAGLKRQKHHKKDTSDADTSTEMGPKDSSSRSVSFRLEAGTSRSTTPRDRRTESDGQTLSMRTDSDASHNAHSDLQESFTDFFSIIHDNVMQSVKEAVQKMVGKCFEQSAAKIEQLSQEIRNQEALVNKIHRDLTSKMAAQSETNMNQFKFVTQMLIDNQTVHYRALNQAKQNRQRRLEDRELEKEQKMERERKRSCSTIKGRSCSMDPSKRAVGGDNKRSQSRGPQHKLAQQQQPLVYQISDVYKRSNTPQIQKQSTSNSLPDLPRSSTKTTAGVPKRSGSRPHANKPDREVCRPAMTYPP